MFVESYLLSAEYYTRLATAPMPSAASGFFLLRKGAMFIAGHVAARRTSTLGFGDHHSQSLTFAVAQHDQLPFTCRFAGYQNTLCFASIFGSSPILSTRPPDAPAPGMQSFPFQK
jgi:hypothetical protein